MKTEDYIIILDETDGLSERGHILKLLAKRLGLKYTTSTKGLLKYLEEQE